jgi:hypothetical protein
MNMNYLRRLTLVFGLLLLNPLGAGASTVYGDLNNFDTVNDTGRECRGFQIEIHGVRSTDITYTFDWNHYGPPRITEDASDPGNPKVFIRYESRKGSDGNWLPDSRTDVPTQVLGPTDGHFCTDPTNYSYGCEHFGVGFYGSPTVIKYNWLQDDGTGNLVLGPPVNVGTPSFTYIAPAPAVPAQLVAAMPAPAVPIPANRKYGEPSWVKAIKTTTHNAGPVALADLVSDEDAGGVPKWQNNEPSEVETEWRLLQTNTDNNALKAVVEGNDDMGDGSETVTRRYEFYKYAGNADTIDGENGEAMCDEVAADGLHGVGTSVAVTDANGDTRYVDCSAQVVVGDYIGAQMAGFAAEAPLGLIDNLQDGEVSTPYTPRTVVVGGNTPFAISILAGNLPQGLAIGTEDGVLEGTPTSGGDFGFTVQATDADGLTVSKAYTMKIAGGVVVQHALSIAKSGGGTGTVTSAPAGIDCGATCASNFDAGTSVTLTATPGAGSVFAGWSGSGCSGTGTCTLSVSAATAVTAAFDIQQFAVTVSRTGAGSGTVTSLPAGINCGATCASSFNSGTPLTLTANADAGSVFVGWTGAGCSGTGTCTLTVSAATAVTAEFVPATQQYTLAVTQVGSGTVTSSPKGINCRKQCTDTFPAGTTVTLTAKPSNKHNFLGWSGDACSGSVLPTCQVPMLGDRNVQATFD